MTNKDKLCVFASIEFGDSLKESSGLILKPSTYEDVGLVTCKLIAVHGNSSIGEISTNPVDEPATLDVWCRSPGAMSCAMESVNGNDANYSLSAACATEFKQLRLKGAPS